MMNTNTNTIPTNLTEKGTLPTFVTPFSEDFGDIPTTLELFRERSETISKKEQPKRSKLIDQMTYDDLSSIVDFNDQLELNDVGDELSFHIYNDLREHYGIYSIYEFIDECKNRYLQCES